MFLMDGQERLDDTATNQIFLFLFRARIGFFFVGFVCHFLGFGHKKKFSFWKMRNAQTRPPAAEQKGIPKPMGVRVQCVCCIFQNREADSSFCVLDLRFFSLLASNENDNQVREREEKENCTFFCVFEQIFALANRNRCVWLWCRWWKLVPSRSMTPLVPEPDAQNRSGRVWLDGAETGNSQFCNSPRRHVHLVPQTHEHTRTCTHTHTHTKSEIEKR